MTSDIKKHIKELISGSENSEVEFKSAKGGLLESFWETFSAFANTNGGIIVLGIKEKNGIFMPDGLNKQQIDTYKKRFWDCAHNKEKVSATGHQHTEIRNKKEATCKETGYSGDTWCKDCGKKILSGQTIAKTENHSWNQGEITKEPT